MGKLLKNSWALFTGYGIIMIAFGFQGNLLGVRSVIENFSLQIKDDPLSNPPQAIGAKSIDQSTAEVYGEQTEHNPS